MIARALRRMGHEVLFIVNDRDRLHRPEFRYPDITYPYPEWIEEIIMYPDVIYALPTPSRRRIVERLRSCDAVIVNCGAPAVIPMVGRPAIAVLTGTDLQVFADYRTLAQATKVNKRPSFLWSGIKHLLYRRLIPQQRAGIAAAVAVNYLAKGLFPEDDDLLEQIGITDDRRLTFMMTDFELIQQQPPPRNAITRVLCATRLTWKQPKPPGSFDMDFKGSDIMIRGLAQFWRETDLPLDVCIVKKGLHVAETLALAEAEGIAHRITWLEEMTQREVQKEIGMADIVIEQLGQAVVGMVGLDAMATGRPVIANCRPEIFEPLIGEPSPICQARTPVDVCAQLLRLAADPQERARVGERSREYVWKHFSAQRAASLCLERLRPHVL